MLNKYLCLTLIFLINVVIVGCDSAFEPPPSCTEDAELEIFLDFGDVYHPSRRSSPSECFLSNIQEPYLPCSETIDDENLLNDASYRDYHLFRVTVSANCENYPFEVFQNLPLNSSFDCTKMVIDVPRDVDLTIDVKYIEVCGQCNENTDCNLYSRTVYVGSDEAFIFPSADLGTVYVRMDYEESLCSDHDDCINYTAKNAG